MLDVLRVDGQDEIVLIARHVLDRIVTGEVTLQFRRWRRPTVRAGGTLRTAVGELGIDAVDAVRLADVTAADATSAGCSSRGELVEQLRGRDGRLYRIVVRYLGEDERIALRTDDGLPAEELALLEQTLAGMDERSRRGPWTAATLAAIARRPAEPAGDLAAELGQEKPGFKRDVRRLKELGLTESLSVGYRLSPRGEELLRRRA